jgi:hypothetical protein
MNIINIEFDLNQVIKLTPKNLVFINDLFHKCISFYFKKV